MKYLNNMGLVNLVDSLDFVRNEVCFLFLYLGVQQAQQVPVCPGSQNRTEIHYTALHFLVINQTYLAGGAWFGRAACHSLDICVGIGSQTRVPCCTYHPE